VMLGVPLTPHGHPVLATVLLCVLFAPSGAGTAISSIAATSIRQAITPTGYIGRMTASYKTVSYGVVALGAICGGVAGEIFGLRAGLWLGAAGLLLTIAWTYATPVPKLRELPAEPLDFSRSGLVPLPVPPAAEPPAEAVAAELLGDAAAIPEPVATEPVLTEPVATEPVLTEPVASEPVVTEPVAAQPARAPVDEPAESAVAD
jgi:hypothetical protein